MKPLNRKAELLLLFMETNKMLSYLDISRELGNNNAHRRREDLEKVGIVFESVKVKTKNRFNNPIEFKKFKLKTKIREAKRIYKIVNK